MPASRFRRLPLAALGLASVCFLTLPGLALAAPEQNGNTGEWRGLANVLDALTPSVDTSAPPSAAQITDRITSLLNQGRYEEAMQDIAQRKAQLANRPAIGNDVQLLFLEARALSALQRHEQAIAIYRDMTIRFPELPEPWNNLANEYIRQGQPELARDALQMALTANPAYATAQANLGTVYLMLARQAWQQAAQAGIDGAAQKARQAQRLLDQ